jgi:hypothetical protein
LSSIVISLHALLAKADAVMSALISRVGSGTTLILISVVVGILLVIAYGKVSFQLRLKSIKRKIFASIFEVIVFRHAPSLTLASQARLVGYGLGYICLAIPPILILAIPSIFILAQLNSWFGYEPISIGKSVIMTATLDSDSAEGVQLQHGDEITATEPLWDKKERQLSWRIEPQRAGSLPLQIIAPGSLQVPISIIAASNAAISPIYSTGFTDNLLYPQHLVSRTALQRISRIEIRYPSRAISWAGMELAWLWWFLIVSILSGMIGARLFKIEL